MRRNWKAVLVAVTTLSLVFAACGDDDDGAAPKSTAAASAVDLPKKIIDAGVLVVGSDIAYPPIEFYKEGTEEVQGLDYDIGAALAERLGVKVKFVNSTFDGILAGLNAGRFDIVMSAMTDKAERQKEADFLDYFQAGTAILVQKGNPEKIATLDDLCGNTVAVQTGTTHDVDLLTPHVDKCKTAGKPLNVLRFDKDTDAVQQVKLGRAVANVADYPVVAYTVKTAGDGKDFDVVEQQIDVAPYGIAMPKTNEALKTALHIALKQIIEDGTYDEILEKWNLGAGALKTAKFNGGK
ncbi:MAG TPA: ABC transporter substrate-binding protein [Acidimicrobiales bacterium]|nr:ABC transporter substrate-binding protein [Acidimicrobiales bacterium]